jgi:hypothetical protein
MSTAMPWPSESAAAAIDLPEASCRFVPAAYLYRIKYQRTDPDTLDEEVTAA